MQSHIRKTKYEKTRKLSQLYIEFFNPLKQFQNNTQASANHIFYNLGFDLYTSLPAFVS